MSLKYEPSSEPLHSRKGTSLLSSELGKYKTVRANSAHIRQPGPDSGPGVRVKVLKTFQVVSFSLGSGRLGTPAAASTRARSASGGDAAVLVVVMQQC